MSDLSMWRYWSAKRGVVEALRLDYPEFAQADTVLHAALTQITVAELAIQHRMQELANRDALNEKNKP